MSRATDRRYTSATAPKRTDSLRCAECGSPLVLKDSRHGMFYGCKAWATTRCGGSVGAHPDGAPMGFPADSITKGARRRAHDAFDLLWDRERGGWMKRSAAYDWLTRELRACGVAIPDGEQAHIGQMDGATCDITIALVARRLEARAREVRDATPAGAP